MLTERMAGGEREKELIEAIVDDWDCDDKEERDMKEVIWLEYRGILGKIWGKRESDLIFRNLSTSLK